MDRLVPNPKKENQNLSRNVPKVLKFILVKQEVKHSFITYYFAGLATTPFVSVFKKKIFGKIIIVI